MRPAGEPPLHAAIQIPPITPQFVTSLHPIVDNAEDGVAKRFLQKLYARGDKFVLGFFERLGNAVNHHHPVERALWRYEKKLLDEASCEYAESEVKRLASKQKESGLSAGEEAVMGMLDMHESTVDYEKRYMRRQILGVGIQLLAIPATPAFMAAFWKEDEDKRKKEVQRHGRQGERSEVYNAYCKTLTQGKGLCAGLLILLLGDMVKEPGLPPSRIWHSRCDELVRSLDSILIPIRGMEEEKNRENGRS